MDVVGWRRDTDGWARAYLDWNLQVQATTLTLHQTAKTIMSRHPEGRIRTWVNNSTAAVMHSLMVMCGHSHSLTQKVSSPQPKKQGMQRRFLVDHTRKSITKRGGSWARQTSHGARSLQHTRLGGAFLQAAQGGRVAIQRFLSRSGRTSPSMQLHSADDVDALIKFRSPS